MAEITKQQYEFAERRIEELLPCVNDYTPPDDPKSVELTLMSDVVEEYEKKHYPIAKPTPSELIAYGLEEKGMTQKELAKELGVSPSRVNDFVKGKSEPSLTMAGKICKILDILPSAMLSCD